MYLRLGGRDIPCTKAAIDYNQNAISEFDVSIPATAIPRDEVLFSDAALFYKGVQYISGVILEPPALELGANLSLRIKGYDEIGRLTCFRAVTDAHFQDYTITAALSLLLGTTPDWSLGDTSTMVDPVAVTTIDLRNKETLFAQIMEVVKATPQCFIRYGGFTAGFHRLDIGFFGAQNHYAIQNDGLTALKLPGTGKRTYNVVEAFSDRSNQNRLTLFEAMGDPRYATDADRLIYPIELDNGKYVCRSVNQPKGCQTSRAFNIIKTKNDQPASAAEIAEAGYALWKKAIRFLQQNEMFTSLSVDSLVSGTPKVSDKMFIGARVREPVYDAIGQCDHLIETFSIYGWYRMTKVHFEFESARKPDPECPPELNNFTFELTDNDYVEARDDDATMYEKLERHDNADIVSGVNGIGVKGLVRVNVTHGPGDPADLACAPDVAKEYVFALPAVPTGATDVFTSTAVKAGAGVVTITQDAALPATPLKACVQAVGGGWPPATPITIEALFTFV